MAWGKVILLGEHAVVHGHPALAGALALGMRARAERRDHEPTVLSVPAWSAQLTDDQPTDLSRALRGIVRATGGGSWSIHVDADIPAGAGLGSSAALSVAITRALSPELPVEELEAIANEAETCFHANPSGVDVALAARGGLGVFVRGHGFTPIDAPPVPLAVGFSGVARSTAAMVNRVANALASEPATVRARLQALGEAASAGVNALRCSQLSTLGQLFDSAQRELTRLGLSTPELDRLCAIAAECGALGAKLSGAGGGGAVIALAPGNEPELLAAWKAAGFHGIACHAGATP